MAQQQWEAGTTTLPEHQSGVSPKGRYYLNVVTSGLSSTHPLPDEGTVTIGRSDTNTIQVNDRSLSRQHAALHIGKDGALTVEDLGSSNGTTVRERLLEEKKPVKIAPGEVVDLGATMIIVQTRGQLARPRRLWAHDYFEARVEDECGRAEQGGKPFALVRVHCPGVEVVTQQVLFERLRPADVLGAYAPGELEAMLVDTSPEAALELIAALREAIGSRGSKVEIGLACFPRDGRNPDALFAKASAHLAPAGAHSESGRIVVADPAMHRLFKLVERVAVGSISVLILGETGAGKEVLAEKLHRLSPRVDKPFLGLSCAALTENLLESELFGHEKGAFTGASAAKPGLLESAEGGTVFLDELGEMPLSTQAKLLRVIETRQVLRVGGLKPRAIDVRFVAATNRDLEAEVARGAFRRDLYFRLNGISIVIPPLRERPTEIAALATLFLERAITQNGRRPGPRLAPESMALLQSYAWPGNIRELKNVMERAVLLCVGSKILPEHLPLEKIRASIASVDESMVKAPRSPRVAGLPTDPPTAAPPPAPPSYLSPGPGPGPGPAGNAPVREELEALERRRILDALATCAGNQTKAAKMLGMSRRTLLHRLDAYGVARPRKGSSP